MIHLTRLEQVFYKFKSKNPQIYTKEKKFE